MNTITEQDEFKRLLLTIPEPLTCRWCGGVAFVRYTDYVWDGSGSRVPSCYYCKPPSLCEYDVAPPSVQAVLKSMTEYLQKAMDCSAVVKFVYRNESRS